MCNDYGNHGAYAVAPSHDRQMVVVPRDRWKDWLYLSRPKAELLVPLPAGSPSVEQVR